MNRACASCCGTRKTIACAIENDFKHHEPRRPSAPGQRRSFSNMELSTPKPFNQYADRKPSKCLSSYELSRIRSCRPANGDAYISA